MDSPYYTIDYTATSFDYPTLTKIHGPPTFHSLTRLKKELKANAQSVTCTLLGGGTNGHLGLVLTPEEYGQVSNVAYDVPAYPGPFALPRNVDPAEAVRRERAHLDRMSLFKQVQDVKQALIRQIVAAVDENYIDELRDEGTNRITKTIPEILRYLFDNFADIEAEDVRREEAKLSEFVWNVMNPPMEFYRKIEELQKLANAANVTKSASQLIAIAIQIIQRTGDFEQSLKEWHRKPPNEKTWIALKRHFTLAHKDLRKVRGKTIQQTSYFQANQLVKEVNDNITQMKSDILDSMSIIQQDRQDNSSVSTPTLPTQTASAVTGSTVSNEDLLLMIQQLQAQLSSQSVQTPPKNFKRKVDHYCWTHGACGHPSNKCRNKKPGHQDNATLDNKMGGSTYYCRIATDQKVAGNA